MTRRRRRLIIAGCYGLSMILLVAAGAHLVLAGDPGLSIFLIIVAVIIARVLVLDVAEPLLRPPPDAPGGSRDAGDPPSGDPPAR